MTNGKSIYNSLKKCYPENVEYLYHEIEQKIVRFNVSQIEEQTHVLEEINAILITYADTLRGDDSPLSVLRSFLLEYVQTSFNTVHLLPFFPYSSDDGFSVLDYESVNPNYGSWEDIQKLSSEYKLMFDAVINHISQKSYWFQSFLKEEEVFKNYFICVNEDEDLSKVTRPRATPLLTVFDTPSGKKRVWTTFSTDQIDLNYKNPDVLLKIIDILFLYIKKGATLIRLDAIGYLWKAPGTCCIHLDQTHEIVKLLRSCLDALKKNALLITETNVPHDENISYFGSGKDEAHMVYNFPLPPLVLHAYLQKSSRDLNSWVENLCYPGTSATYFNFLASHDGIGLMPLNGLVKDSFINALVKRCEENGGRISYKRNEDGTQTPYEMNITYFDAISERKNSPDDNIRKFLGAYSIAFALKGIPGVYIHSLLGSVNWQEGVMINGHNRAINRERIDLENLIAQLQDKDSRRNNIFFGMKKMLDVRASQKAFSLKADQKVIHGDNRLFIIQRSYDGDCVIVIINLTEEQMSVDLHEMNGYDLYRDILTNEKYHRYTNLEAYGYRWLKRERGVSDEK